MISLSAGCCGDSCNQHSYELGYETNRASAFGSFGIPNGPGTDSMLVVTVGEEWGREGIVWFWFIGNLRISNSSQPLIHVFL